MVLLLQRRILFPSLRKRSLYTIAESLGINVNEANIGVLPHTISIPSTLHKSKNPSTGEWLPHVAFGSASHIKPILAAMDVAKRPWMNTPAPIRGEVVRKIGEALRKHKKSLATIISSEMGKILTESEGEIQEAIDICDYAVGLSRSLNGLVIPSERPGHFMMEKYNPLKGHVAIITAFNFPVAVYFWNAALSMVCGNTHVWKPHESGSVVAIAVTKLVMEVLQNCGHDPAIASLICGTGAEIGEALIANPRIELVSFTGSTHVGRHVSQTVAARFGKQILELGGNNAMVVDNSANLDMAVRATLFGSVGTAGQRCTTQRRCLVHADVYDEFLRKLKAAYGSVKIGHAMDPTTLCGPLHNAAAVETFRRTVTEATSPAQGGIIEYGGRVLDDRPGYFVEPTIITLPLPLLPSALGTSASATATSTTTTTTTTTGSGSHSFSSSPSPGAGAGAGPSPCASISEEERFVPILYVMKVNSFEEAIRVNNSVSQGLSSSLFTQDLSKVFQWTGAEGSDCGICNVNIGTSGAEIGGKFGGEKNTGGGRESGGDSWKQYCRQSTCTINYSDALPLAQGVNFDV